MADPHEGSKYAYLKNLSIERLEEILTTNSDTSDKAEELIDAVVEVMIEKEREHPTGRITDVDQAWDMFQKHFNTPEGKGLTLYPEEGTEDSNTEKEKIVSFKHRRKLRTILVAAALIVVMVVFMLPAAMGYTSFFEMVGQWTEDIFQFSPNRALPPTGDKPVRNDVETEGIEYDSLQEALDAYGITDAIAPSSFPDEYVLDEVNVETFGDSRRIEISAFFVNKDKSFSILVIEQDNDSLSKFEKDYKDVEIYTLNDVDHYIFENNGRLTAAWSTHSFEVSILSDLSVEEVKKMIDSVYERER